MSSALSRAGQLSEHLKMGSGRRPVIFIPGDLHPASVEFGREHFDVIRPGDERAEEWWKYAEGIPVKTGGVAAEDVLRSPTLKIIARNGVGLNTIPLDVCRTKGVCVTHLPGMNASTVAELAVTLALNVARRVTEMDRGMRAGRKLEGVIHQAQGIWGKTIGLVGMGNIARLTGEMFLSAFHCKLIVYSPHSATGKWGPDDLSSGLPPLPHTRYTSLDDFMRDANVVSLHVPFTPTTANLIGKRELELLGPEGILVNTARGEVVDEAALLEALKQRTIFGAGLDVFVHEPATRASYDELFSLENVVLTPHAGAGTDEMSRRTCCHAVEMLRRFLISGEDVEHRVV